MGDLDSDATSHLDSEGSGRREFLKKAGKIAFVVPAIQVLSMAPAGAQSNGSVVTTTPPGSTMPPTTTTTTTTTTTAPTTTTTEAPCTDEVRYHVKADWDQDERRIIWTTEFGANDCFQDSSQWDDEILGSAIGVNIDTLVVDKTSGELSGARMWVGNDCYFDFAAVKAGQACQVVNLNGGITIFENVTSPSISHFEAIVVCCEESP